MQDDLFGEATPEEDGAAAPSPRPRPRKNAAPGTGPKIRPLPASPELQALARALPPRLRLGTSTWSYPGWAGLVWNGEFGESLLAKHGLEAYGQHPLLRAVSIDRSFYRPLTVSQYARFAAQVPDDFRFVVKAPSMVTDALIRREDGRGMEPNPLFLDPVLAAQEFVQPALEGLGGKIGALVFQLSPLPPPLLADLPGVLQRLEAMLLAMPALQPTAPDGVLAVEVRDAAFVTPAFAELLRRAGATYCLGLHPKLPPIEAQLPLLRDLWPGPLVCRWNLNARHGAYGYEDAEKLYQPFDKLVHPDPATREVLARVIRGTTSRGQNAFVTISNKAEGCAPLTVQGLAEAVAAPA